MDKQDKSLLFNPKMDLYSEGESLAEPAIVRQSNDDTARCRWRIRRVALVAFVVVLILAAFIGGYLVRRAVHKPKTCKVDVPSSQLDSSDSVKLQEILAEMSPESIESTLRNLTLKPHYASFDRNTELAHFIHGRWKSYGFDAKIIKYNVLLSFPMEGKTNGAFLLNGSGEIMYRTAEKEKVVEPSEADPDVLPPFNAYSATGKAKGDLVYANYGKTGDFEYLLSKGVNCSGKIVIVKYGHIFRGDKVTNAQIYGAKAILIYNDPKDFAPVSDKDLYPHSWWLPRSGVQRGSILMGVGDPLTLRYPSKEGVLRQNVSEAALPKIPAHPLSAGDAEPFLRLLGGEEAPRDWQGGLNITYHIGPGFSDKYKDWKVEVETNNNHTRRDIFNVIAVLKGVLEPDRLVLLGNHRDAWVFGGIDPSSGTACMMEIAKALGKKYVQGWRPRRSIVLCSWDAEEYGLVGSTEWVEDNVHLLYQRAVAYLNVDSAADGNYSLFVRASPLLHQVLFNASKQVRNPLNQSQTVYDNWLDKFPAADGMNPRIVQLGSGSDYSPFYQRAGVPSADLTYVFDKNRFFNTSGYPTYHSVHDTFTYSKRFVDPQFTTHLAVAQVMASAAFLLAETPLLPINCSDYAVALQHGVMDVQKNYGKNLSKEGISLHYLVAAVRKFWIAAEIMQSVIDDVNHSNPWSLAFANDRLVGLERNFLNPQGLPGRPLYWHSIYAPSRHNSYASAPFPGLNDALEDAVTNGNWLLVKEQLSDTVVAIEWAAQFLNSSV